MRVFTAATLLIASAIAHGATPEEPPKSVYEFPKRLKLDIEWPGEMNREAYVVVEFDLLANGSTANVQIAEGGFYEKRFANAAISAVKNSRWQPRRIDGVAVETLKLRQPISFLIPNVERGITREFRDEARKVEELIKNGDYAGGEFHAEWMLAEKVKLNYEYAILQAQLAQTYAGQGRIEDAVRKLSRATARSEPGPAFLQLLESPPPNKASSYMLEQDLIVQLLAFRMRLLASQGLALEAMQAYYELAGLQQLPPGSPEAVLAAQLTARIRGNGELRGKIEIREERGWTQFLSRRKFTLEKVRGGNIVFLALACEGKFHELSYAPGEEWLVPQEWGLCKAIVQADADTTFDFVEHPDTPLD